MSTSREAGRAHEDVVETPRVRDRSADLDEAGMWTIRRALRKAAVERSRAISRGVRLKCVELKTATKTSPATVRRTSSISGGNGGASGRDGDVVCGEKGSDASVDGSRGHDVGGEDDEDDGKVGEEDDGEVGDEDDGEVGDDGDGELGDEDDGDVGDEDDGEVGEDGDGEGGDGADGEVSDEDDGEVGDDDDGEVGDDGDEVVGDQDDEGGGDEDDEVVGDEDNEEVGDEDLREDGGNDGLVNGASSRGGRQGARAKKASKAARSVSYKARPGIAFTSGDAALKAGVSHAVIALGVYRMVVGQRKAGDDQAAASLARGACASPEIFVVGRRPRRSVRLLVSMASGCWVVSDTWLLDSLQQRAWKPCADYVSPLFPGVLAARAAHAERRPLLDGLLVGCRGVLDVDLDVFGLLVEAAGGRLGNRGAAVVVEGSLAADQVRLPGGTVYVNQRWLPDSIARWKVLPYADYASA